MKPNLASRREESLGRPAGRVRHTVCAVALLGLFANTPGWAQGGRPHGTAGGIAAAANPDSRSAPDSAEQLAERLYGDGELDAAMQIYRRRIARDPVDSFAWLRIGNIEHRKTRLLPAASAYRKAARAANGPRAEQQKIRAKALLNLAIVNLELAGQAIAEYDRSGDGVASGQARRMRQQAGQELHSTRHEIATRSKSVAVNAQLPEPLPSASGPSGSSGPSGPSGLAGTADWPQAPVLPGWPDPQGAQ